MTLDILKELKLFDVELGRWKHFLRNEMKSSPLPDFIVASMSIEDMIEFVLKDNKDLTSEQK